MAIKKAVCWIRFQGPLVTVRRVNTLATIPKSQNHLTIQFTSLSSPTLSCLLSSISSDVQLTEEAVRRYLIRKPMTTKDLLKKFQTKRTGLSSDQTVNVLAQILKKLNPERKNISDKMHFYLTE